jgi:hypothetical protein
MAQATFKGQKLGSRRSFSYFALSLTRTQGRNCEEEQIRRGIFLWLFCNISSRPPKSAVENVKGISALSKVSESAIPSCAMLDTLMIFNSILGLNSPA